MSAATECAGTFHKLHHQPELLILANAWDAGSAPLIESLGAKAIATTSAGVAWTRGYPDGEALPPDVLVASVAEIAPAVQVPLSVDVEGGFAQDPKAVGDVVARLIDAGAVGINIKDGCGTPDLLCAKIERAKRAGAQLVIGPFVNARTDVYLRASRRPRFTVPAKPWRAASALAPPARTVCSYLRWSTRRKLAR
jgi:2-methylisocitrate lyase-like PEP mutase family enzyme